MGDLLATVLHWTIRALEFAGIAVIVIGAVSSTAAFFVRKLRSANSDESYRFFRAGLSRSILLGLEFLVAADIINTVAIEPTLYSVAVLGGIVLIRTFLSITLEVEVDGRWPWRRRQEEGEASSH